MQVSEMLDSEWPKLRNSSLLDTWKVRDERIRSLGPAMVLVDPADIARLGRIPEYSEEQSITMSEAHKRAQEKGLRFFVEFFSHRWICKNRPDDDENSQAASLVEWALYRRANGLDSYFWIDYSCINQQDVAPGVTMLPLYVASSNNILCYDAPGYETRAWCRIERTLFAAFCAPTQDLVSRGFTYSGDPGQKPRIEEFWILQDPEEGLLSYKEDKSKIAELKMIAEAHWGDCWKEGLYDDVKDKMGSIDALVCGKTQIRCRCF